MSLTEECSATLERMRYIAFRLACKGVEEDCASDKITEAADSLECLLSKWENEA
jgi:hypothetical protein